MTNPAEVSMSHRGRSYLVAALALLFVAGTGWADDTQPETKAPDKKEGFKPKFAKPGELKKYDEVITAKAKTAKGVFTVHRIDDKVYFEIPASAYGKLMLWTSEIAKAPPG